MSFLNGGFVTKYFSNNMGKEKKNPFLPQGYDRRNPFF